MAAMARDVYTGTGWVGRRRGESVRYPDSTRKRPERERTRHEFRSNLKTKVMTTSATQTRCHERFAYGAGTSSNGWGKSGSRVRV